MVGEFSVSVLSAWIAYVFSHIDKKGLQYLFSLPLRAEKIGTESAMLTALPTTEVGDSRSLM